MSSCNWFTHSLRTFLAWATHGAIAMKDSEDGRLENESRDIEDGSLVSGLSPP